MHVFKEILSSILLILERIMEDMIGVVGSRYILIEDLSIIRVSNKLINIGLRMRVLKMVEIINNIVFKYFRLL
jgi:hypothetical protein